MRLGLDAGANTLDLAVELGIRGVPISAEQLGRDGVDATLAPLRERGLQVCQIGAFGFNVLSTDRAKQARQQAILEQAIPLAVATGCPYIVICGGNYHPSGFGAGDVRNFTDAALDEIAAGLAPLLALAEQHGVCLSIEPYLKTAICSAERFLALWERVKSPALRANLDVTSLYDYADLWHPTATIQPHVLWAGRPLRPGPYQRDRVDRRVSHPRRARAAGHRGRPTGLRCYAWSRRTCLPIAGSILEHVATPDEARASVAYLRAAAAQAGADLH